MSLNQKRVSSRQDSVTLHPHEQIDLRGPTDRGDSGWVCVCGHHECRHRSFCGKCLADRPAQPIAFWANNCGENTLGG